ncbi:MAG: S41 family peptidase [Candidatus Komeilibacteria bacterium]
MAPTSISSGPRPGYRLGWLVVVAVAFLAGYFLALSDGQAGSKIFDPWQFRQSSEQLAQEHAVDFSVFWKVWDLLKGEYVDRSQLDEQKLYYGAIRGMVDAVGDPHTLFLAPQENQEFSQDLNGSFDGIGAEISAKDGNLVVVAPLPGSPAAKAGIKAGDIILSIDDVSAQNLNIDEAVAKIRGPKGTSVVLLVIHKDSTNSKPEKITVQRDTIDIPVISSSVDASNIATIRIISFNQDVEKKFISALNDITKKNPKGLIIDLRNNPGGFLDQAVAIASAWVKEGDVVVKESFIDAGKDTTYAARKFVRAPEVPTVVLINGGSASASEILAGALQDYGLATVVGEKSYGKGSVQNLEQLPDGSAVKITVAKWLTPKGRSIQDQGIQPDVVVPFTDADVQANKDPQLDKALELIKQKQP